MKVLIPNTYLMTFNLPEGVRAYATVGRFYNLARIWQAADAIAAYLPVPSCQVVHFMNRIPLATTKPWVISFESGLPRTHNRSRALGKLMRERLLSDRCLRLIAMSQWASGIFQLENHDWKKLPRALAKLSVIYPTVPAKRTVPKQLKKGETLEIAFVGNELARKGGIVALRLAKKAADMGLNIKVHIVSAMNYTWGSLLDHPDLGLYAADVKYLDLPNVMVHGALPNDQVHELLARSHLLLLATLQETFGFSVLEGFAWGVPAMTTNICALPEMVTTGENGFLLQIEKDERNGWAGLSALKSDYWPVLNKAYDSMSEQALQCVLQVLDEPELLERLSGGAIETLRTKFNPVEAARALEEIYSKSTAWS